MYKIDIPRLRLKRCSAVGGHGTLGSNWCLVYYIDHYYDLWPHRRGGEGPRLRCGLLTV